MFAIFLSAAASASDYVVSDLFDAWRAGLPDRVTTHIAKLVPAATAAEKACLLAGGVPAPLVGRVAGADPASLPAGEEEGVCAPFGIDLRGDAAAEAAHNARQAAERRAARQALEDRRDRVACRKPKPGDGPRTIEAWMRDRVGHGATGFVALPSGLVINGTGGDAAVLCSW